MKKFYVAVFLAFFPLFLMAGHVNLGKAERVALNFYIERAGNSRVNNYNQVEASSSAAFKDSSGQTIYYVIGINTGGFVLVSGSDNIIPVLGYSFEGTFNRHFCNVSSWVGHYEKQIQEALNNTFEIPSAIKNEWDRLSVNYPVNLADMTDTISVSPLLVSKWNQDKYYNGQCPQDPAGPGGRCYAGCVATTMGQLMYYYRFPQQGQGSYSYVHPDYGSLSADFGSTTYDWNGMPSSISTINNPIALLLFHLGVSVDMDYGPDGSGMWNHKAAYSLKTYFKYGPETQYYFRDSVSLNWDSILVVNLNQRKPLYYAGWTGVQSTNGHAFICDGYQGTNYFHFNWGWGGQSDGYFYTNNLTPGGNNFNYAQEVIPLFPDTLQNTYPAYCSGKTVLNAVRGSIEDGSGWADYQPNSQCSWLIEPQNPEFDSISGIMLTFTKLNTEPGNDLIFIYDGDTTSAPLLGAFSGNSLPLTITSSGNRVLIVFQTNGSDNRDGWQMDYEPVFPVYCTGTTTLTEPFGSISDGSGPKKYNNNTLCKWRIQPPDAGAVTLSFTSFELTDSLDVLRVFDQTTSQLLGTFTGTQLPPTVTANSGKMLLMFFTNNTMTSQGWEADYTSSSVGLKETGEDIVNITISPNPAQRIIYIDLHSTTSNSMTIEILSTVGNQVFSKDFGLNKGKNQVSIDVSQFPKSLYFLRIAMADQQVLKKIVIN